MSRPLKESRIKEASEEKMKTEQFKTAIQRDKLLSVIKRKYLINFIVQSCLKANTSKRLLFHFDIFSPRFSDSITKMEENELETKIDGEDFF